MENFVWSARVYYEDTDASGLVFYANYLKFMERARTEWLRSNGLTQRSLMKDPGIIFVVRKAEVNYFSPAFFDDLLTIKTNINRIQGASLEFNQQVICDKKNNPLCQGIIKVACLDSNNLKPKKIPQNVRQKFLI